MGTLMRGDVVIIPFPFSDLSATKRRPALVLAILPGDDLIICQITSKDGGRYLDEDHMALWLV